MDKKSFIVVQGPMDYFKQVKESYVDFENVIYSGWKTDLNTIKDEKYFIINKKPLTRGHLNINLQVKSSSAGIKLTLKLGATHVLKVRSDMVFSDIKLLLSLCDDSSVYFPAVCTNTKESYYIDYFQYAPIETMIKLWSIPMKFKQFSKMYPEFYITNHFIKNVKNVNVKYLYPICKEHNIKCFWLKRGGGGHI
ncbi:hypothetical protein [Helicobacter turcicus]|uniref:Uncharacterized protein n=1 Tax=Helicobacter turcicus TaxID=2867412 RepID=A0ABS7JN69_9HELI|nr:hypothetical protein [Helicobacter turcicus]MBX7490817.1 hypothetical protein [Helicobacter turcicus]MBX7545574.1 hypothetical protein [Helicobacter turcicus]